MTLMEEKTPATSAGGFKNVSVYNQDEKCVLSIKAKDSRAGSFAKKGLEMHFFSIAAYCSTGTKPGSMLA